MLRLIKLILTVAVLLTTWIVVETAVTVIRPHRSVEAEQYETSIKNLAEDTIVLESFIVAQGS